MWTEPFESTTVNHGSLDESIQALTDILSDEYGRYDGGGWYLATEEEIRNAIGYLEQYRDLLNKSRSERLIDILREVRGEK